MLLAIHVPVAGGANLVFSVPTMAGMLGMVQTMSASRRAGVAQGRCNVFLVRKRQHDFADSGDCRFRGAAPLFPLVGQIPKTNLGKSPPQLFALAILLVG
jgi:hypothetical protein